MKWYIIIGSGIVVVIAAIFYFFFIPKNVPDTSVAPSPTLPIAGSIDNTTSDATTTSASNHKVSISGQDNSTLIVSDFIHNGETVQDVQNPGRYVLAGDTGYCLADGTCPSGAKTKDFSVSYNTSSQFFNIVLLAEPLGTSRSEAEHFLESRLGLDDDALCDLNYFVGTPYWVSTFYTGKNLGFSFCSGATVFPK